MRAFQILFVGRYNGIAWIARMKLICYHFQTGSSNLLVQALVTLVCIFITNQATHAQDSAASAVAIEFFEKSVRPLLVTRCYECHSGQKRNGGLRLDYRDAVLQGGDSGLAIELDSPDKSLLVQAIHYKNPDLQMPPKGALSPSEIAIFEKWIAIGLPDPRTNPNVAAAPSPTGLTVEAGR